MNPKDKKKLEPDKMKFAPASSHIIDSGTQSPVREWIILGILNGLVITLSHLIYSLYIFLGPIGVMIGFFHQSAESLLIAGVYLLMPYCSPNGWPFTLNAAIWSAMGLSMGWWPILPVAVPAGIITDIVLHMKTGTTRRKKKVFLFAFYSTALCAANSWPYLFLQQSDIMHRMTTMDPGISKILGIFTIDFFILQLLCAFISALFGGSMAMRMITKHFRFESE